MSQCACLFFFSPLGYISRAHLIFLGALWMVLGWEVSQEAECGLGFSGHLGRGLQTAQAAQWGGLDFTAQETWRPVKQVAAAGHGAGGLLVHLPRGAGGPGFQSALTPASTVASGLKEPEVASVTKLIVTHSCLPLFRPHGLQPARPLCPWGFSRQGY